MKLSLFIFADGGSRGNPGPAAVGFVVKDSQGRILGKKGRLIGQATNNVAEYRAVIEALDWLRKKKRLFNLQSPVFHFFLDSKLIVNQLNGLFKIKNPHLRELVIRVRQLEQAVGGKVCYTFIHRAKNREADRLVNQVLGRD